MQAASLALREKYNVDRVDFALIYNPSNPAGADPVFASINEQNALFNLASILPVAQANQHLGSLLMFDSDLHLQRYVADSVDLYHIWPSGWRYASRDYLYYVVFKEVFYEYYKKHNDVMHLTCRPFMADWANSFYLDHVYPNVPITVNIRNNKLFQTWRNSSLDVWIEFFKYCESRFPAKFIVICSWSEIDDRFRYCSNVILAKDHHTGIEQELALIHTSAIHMGVGSGPVSMAWFNKNPYLMVNTVYETNHFRQKDFLVDISPGVKRFCFGGPLQRIIESAETIEILIREFTLLWKSVDLEFYKSQSKSNRAIDHTHTWLR